MDFIKTWHKLRFTLLLGWKLRESSTSLQKKATENGNSGGTNTELFFLHFIHKEKGQSSGGTGCWVFAFPPSSYCWDTKGSKIMTEAISRILENIPVRNDPQKMHIYLLSLHWICLQRNLKPHLHNASILDPHLLQVWRKMHSRMLRGHSTYPITAVIDF